MRPGEALAAISLLALAAPLVSGAVVERLALPDLAARAERIFEARVLATIPARDLRGRPATRVRFLVTAPLAGAADGVAEALLPGGTIDGETLAIHGVPRFAPGDDVVVFLTGASRGGTSVPVGLGQGVYRAAPDASGRRLYRPDLRGLALVDPATGSVVEAPAESVERDVLLERVRRLVSAR